MKMQRQEPSIPSLPTSPSTPILPNSRGRSATNRDFHRSILLLLAAYQFFHWFEPSEALWFNYALRRVKALNNSSEEMNNRVFVYDTPAYIIGAIIIGLCVAVGGERLALVICGLALAATQALTIWPTSLYWLIASQVIMFCICVCVCVTITC